MGETNRKETATELHNRLAGPIVAAIMRPILESDGKFSDVLVLLESVIVGTILAIVKLGGDEIAVDALAERVKARLAELRLRDIETKGEG